MSIAIDSMKCRACGKCLDVCPGSLIVRGEDKKAVIRYPKDCWGCASCIKECPFEAISYYRIYSTPVLMPSWVPTSAAWEAR